MGRADDHGLVHPVAQMRHKENKTDISFHLLIAASCIIHGWHSLSATHIHTHHSHQSKKLLCRNTLQSLTQRQALLDWLGHTASCCSCC